jgi:hypothetical protein
MAQALAQIACAFYWLNPLVWVAARQLRLESENACDDAVISSGTKASVYAGHLLEIARTFSLAGQGARGALTIARPSQLESRLRTILSPDRRRQRAGGRLRPVLVSLGLLTIGLGLAALSPYERKAGAQVKSGQVIQGSTEGVPVDNPLPTAGDKAATANVAVAQQAVKPPSGEAALSEAAGPGQNEHAVPEAVPSAPTPKFIGQDSAFISRRISEYAASAQSAGPATQDDDEKRTKRDPKMNAAVEALTGALDDKDPDVRANAIWALSMNGGKASEDALISALKDPDAHVRSQAAWGLGLHGDKKAIEPLIAALKDTQAHVRSQAAWALGLKGDNRAVEPLIAALNDEQPQVRSMAAWALGLKGDGRAVDALKALLKDPSDHARRQAAWALGMLLMKSGDGDGNEDEQESDGQEGTVRHSHRRGRG